MTVRIRVDGAPVAKGRPRFAQRGKGVVVITPKKTADYESHVRFRAARVMDGQQPLAPPISIRLSIDLEPPSSWSKKRRLAAVQGGILPTKRPDADNYAKAVLDALNGVVFGDDSHITDLIVTKRYAASAGVTIVAATIDKGAAA